MRLVLLWCWGLMAAVGCGQGCGCGEPEGDQPAELVSAGEPVEAPEGLVWEGSLAGAGALAAVRDQLPARLRPIVPATPGALLERAAPQLPMANRVQDDADLWALAVDVDGSERVVMAAPVTVGEGPLALGADLPLTSGAPHGGRWIGGVPGREEDAAMLLGDVLLVSESPRALGIAAPYLAFTLIPRGAPPGIRVRLPDGFVSQTLRRAADRLVSHQAEQAIAAARAERERHDAPPTYGDPEALITSIRDALRKVVAYMPDVGEATVTLGANETGLSLRVDAEVERGSPLAEALTGSTAGRPFGIGALPQTTALAWSTRTEQNERPSLVASTLEAMGGERMGAGRADATEALTALDRAVGETRGEGVVVSVGADGATPWALVATAPTPEGLDPATVQRALGAPYLRDVMGGLAGCGGPVSLRHPQRPAGGGARTTLCTTASGQPALLAVARAGEAWAVSVSRGETGAAEATAARLGDADQGGGAPGGGLGSHPDIGRALSALGDEVLLAALVVPSRLWAAAALLPFEAFQQAGADTATAARPAPLVLGASRSDGGLRIQIVASAAAMEDLVSVLEPILGD